MASHILEYLVLTSPGYGEKCRTVLGAKKKWKQKQIKTKQKQQVSELLFGRLDYFVKAGAVHILIVILIKSYIEFKGMHGKKYF